jgi:protein-ribulosamine 3-kinase
MLCGEFESAKEIYRLTPGLIPEPYGYGRYKEADPVTYFYLSEFMDMDLFTPPSPDELAAKLSELHTKSEPRTGKFGFHVVTCDGRMPHTVDWQDSWAVFFARLLQGVCRLDTETNGRWPEMELALEQLVDKVIPRLLGNLTHKGQPIKPSIIHGDLWEPNLGINRRTGEVVMYDAHTTRITKWTSASVRDSRGPSYCLSPPFPLPSPLGTIVTNSGRRREGRLLLQFAITGLHPAVPAVLSCRGASGRIR